MFNILPQALDQSNHTNRITLKHHFYQGQEVRESFVMDDFPTFWFIFHSDVKNMISLLRGLGSQRFLANYLSFLFGVRSGNLSPQTSSSSKNFTGIVKFSLLLCVFLFSLFSPSTGGDFRNRSNRNRSSSFLNSRIASVCRNAGSTSRVCSFVLLWQADKRSIVIYLFTSVLYIGIFIQAHTFFLFCSASFLVSPGFSTHWRMSAISSELTEQKSNQSQGVVFCANIILKKHLYFPLSLCSWL